MKTQIISLFILVSFWISSVAEANKMVLVNVDNFIRAETDRYLSDLVKGGGLGKLIHTRELTNIDQQTVIRMNRDTLYSYAVFDLSKSPVTVTLPPTNNRFMSMQIINQDHYTLEVIYDNKPHEYDMEKVGTRYVAILFRTFVDPGNKDDLIAAHAAQDAIKFKQESVGEFNVPNWDKASLDKAKKCTRSVGLSWGR